jgi:hypothetical protein
MVMAARTEAESRGCGSPPRKAKAYRWVSLSGPGLF